MPKWKAVLMLSTGWFELYSDGKVFFHQYYEGTRSATEEEASIIVKAYAEHKELFKEI